MELIDNDNVLVPDERLLIDADIVAYQAAAVAQDIIDWGEGPETSVSMPKAISRVKEFVEDIKVTLNSGHLVFVFSDATFNWRKEILWDSYKENRKGAEKPLLLTAVREYIESNYECVMVPRLEADDVMGIMATDPDDLGGIIVSLDKDMKTVPCKWYSWGTGKLTLSTEYSAMRFLCYQTLTGDPSDGYKGCWKVGPKKAEKALDAAVDDANSLVHYSTDDPEGHQGNSHSLMWWYWQHVLWTYEAQYEKYEHLDIAQAESDALTNARMAHILRHGDYDFDTEEIKLWVPPTE